MMNALTEHIAAASRPSLKREWIVFRKLYDNIFYRGYLAASEQAIDDVVSRYGRRNIAIQFKRFLTTEKLQVLHVDGDRAAKRLAKRVARATR